MPNNGQICSLYVAPVHAVVGMLYGHNSGGCLRTTGSRALIGAWLNAAQGSQNGVLLNTTTAE